MASSGTVALHHAVVQQVARASVGERGALELHRVHLVDETKRTEQISVPADKRKCKMGGEKKNKKRLTCSPDCDTCGVRREAGSSEKGAWPGL